jgi:predicted RNase H-like HicB family nuclease
MNRREVIGPQEAQYFCTFHPEPEGGYTVRCEAFPEIVTYGHSLSEAQTNAREAIELCLEVYQDEGRSIPRSDVDPRKTIREVVSVKLDRG